MHHVFFAKGETDTMTLPMSILLDLALGLILLSILYNSWQRGFVASLISLVGTAAGFLAASFLSRPLAGRIYDTVLEQRVERYVADTFLAPDGPLSAVMAGIDQAGGAAVQAIADLLTQYGLDYYSDRTAGEMGGEIFGKIGQMGNDPASAIAQVAIRPLVMTVLEIAIFFLLIFVIRIIVGLAVRVGLGVNEIPLIGGVNRMAGLLCGAVYALLMGFLLSMGLVLLAGLGKNQWTYLNSGILRDTFLIRHLLELRQYLP